MVIENSRRPGFYSLEKAMTLLTKKPQAHDKLLGACWSPTSATKLRRAPPQLPGVSQTGSHGRLCPRARLSHIGKPGRVDRRHRFPTCDDSCHPQGEIRPGSNDVSPFQGSCFQLRGKQVIPQPGDPGKKGYATTPRAHSVFLLGGSIGQPDITSPPITRRRPAQAFIEKFLRRVSYVIMLSMGDQRGGDMLAMG